MAIRNARIDFTTAINAQFTPVPAGVTSPGASLPISFQQSWTDVVGVTNRIQTVGYATGTLAAGATATLDLTAFPAADGGTAITLTKLSVLYIQITSTTVGGKLRIGGTTAGNTNGLWFDATSNKWTINANGPAFVGGDLVTSTGITVDATHKNVYLENTSGVSIDYAAIVSGLT